MLYKVCTEVQAINTYISSKPYNSYAKQSGKAGLLLLASNDIRVKINEMH